MGFFFTDISNSHLKRRPPKSTGKSIFMIAACSLSETVHLKRMLLFLLGGISGRLSFITNDQQIIPPFRGDLKKPIQNDPNHE